MHTHFSAQTLAEIFRDLFVGERDGVLTLTREDTEKRVYFSRGLIVYGDSSLEHEELGYCLVREGKISEGALEEALGHCTDRSELGLILVRRDLLGREMLAETTSGIVRQIVASVFQWQGGTAQFQEGSQHPDLMEGDVLDTLDAILSGIGQMIGFGPIQEAMLGLSNTLGIASPAPMPLERLRLTPSQGYVLSRVDGTSNASDLVSILPPEEERPALQFLFGLLVLGLIEYVPRIEDGVFRVTSILRDHADRQALEKVQQRTIEQAYQSMPNKDPYEILGVTPNASREAVERAYGEAKAIFGKDRVLPHLREQFRSELAVIENRLVEAYLQLSQPESFRPAMTLRESGKNNAQTADDLLVRVEMDKTQAKLAIEEAVKVADDYYALAKKSMREGDFHNAIQYGKLAISYNKDDARYYFMLADCQARNPEARWQRMAEENFNRATELDPWNPEYLIRLGRFYKKRGLKLRAIKQFEEALKLSPKHEAAGKELASLRS